MSEDAESQMKARERLSALADGVLDAHEVAGACALWRSDADARATWHAYHVIGDVLRSDDLAQDAPADAAFVLGLRARLSTESTVLAPQPLLSPGLQPAAAVTGLRGNRRRGWWASSAVAAGVVAVAGVLLVTRMPYNAAGAGSAVASLTGAPAAGTVATPSPTAGGSGAPVTGDVQALAVNSPFVRDAQLDRYLAAHKQFAGSSALGVPSGFLRSATVEMSGQ